MVLNAKNVAVGVAAGMALGTASMAGKVALIQKNAQKTGKPAGVQGSMMHILTNDKLDKSTKKEVIKEINKESNKETLKLLKVSAILAGIASVATSCSSTVANASQKLIKLPVIKSLINNVEKASTVKNLPTPVKAAIAVGTLAAAILTPLAIINSGAKAGYIEGKSEIE